MRPRVQIDVVTPASSYSLVDLTTLKTLLDISGSSLDAYFDLIIPEASGLASAYANNPFVVEVIQSSYWPSRDGWPWIVQNRIAPLQLVRYPVVSPVTSVVETIAGVPTTLVENTDFIVDYAKGQITRLDQFGYPRNWHANPIVVVFSAGYATIPPNVVKAVVEIVKGIYFARTRDPNIRSENIEGVYEAQFWFGAGPGSPNGLPTSITGLLEPYRVPVFG